MTQPRDPRGELAERLQEAITGAIGICDHTDTGGPIYEPVRPCATCSTDAVMALIAQVDTEAGTTPGRHILDPGAPLRLRYVLTTDWNLTQQAHDTATRA